MGGYSSRLLALALLLLLGALTPELSCRPAPKTPPDPPPGTSAALTPDAQMVIMETD